MSERSSDELARLLDWRLWARPDQLPPEGDWTVWLYLGGRGAGKTRAGAEWVKGLALGQRPFAREPLERIALVGETLADVRDVMVEGPSGLLGLHRPSERPSFSATRRRLLWPNGAQALMFSSQDPESLRGPQFHAAWCDELAKWTYAEATFDMLQFGLRLGINPRQLVTTTPRNVPLVKRLLAAPRTAVTKATTAMNADNLAPGFLEAVVGRYRGTRLGRQELDAELISDRPDALFKRADIEAERVGAAPELIRVVVAVDPPASSGREADSCGIVAAGRGADGFGYVLADKTAQGLSPAGWAGRAVDLFHALSADRLVAEANQGGDMVAAVIRQADPSVAVRLVHASRGKVVRAEPVAALYEQGRIRHVGALPELEDEMADFGLGGLSSGRSPDRVDALVWALTELMLTGGGEARVRRI
ncbi:DNA-packaging protein [Afifella marina]|nr:terminase family protein [Afifella marina]MBK1625183.1 ATP-binding protein [Afifella marina DSM 2698]MBK1628900.1 ATP-binding protein [Afifella marina]MBK5918279.1 ATP-binding protein [Afifella marina]RAI22913.1 ATP-binding protein [Afifella marina DSM 2698]